MKKTIALLSIMFALISCGKQPSEGEKLLNTLNEQGLSLLVLNNDSVSQHGQHGVKDLLCLLQTEPERLQGAVVADKMIGKAAASLMILGGVTEVNTNLICLPAKKMLEDAGVVLHAAETCPMILNRDRSGQCPLDSRLKDVDNAEDCYQIIVDFYSNGK